jgi:hypothetical protein
VTNFVFKVIWINVKTHVKLTFGGTLQTHQMPPTVYGGLVIQPAVNLVDFQNKWAAKIYNDPNYNSFNYHLAPPDGPECGKISTKALLSNISFMI